MPGADDWTDADFVPADETNPVGTDPESRYSLLLRVIRFLLARDVSFTMIEETLVAAGVPAEPAEEVVELVIQSLQGKLVLPDAYPALEVTEAVLRALGVPSTGVQPRPGSLLAIAAGTDPAPEFAFAGENPAQTSAALTRTRDRQQSLNTRIIVAVVALTVVGALLALMLF